MMLKKKRISWKMQLLFFKIAIYFSCLILWHLLFFGGLWN
jgi:hypothetical protein